MAVVMNEQFLAESLRFDDKTARAIWSESDDFANDAITRNLYGCEMSLRSEREC